MPFFRFSALVITLYIVALWLEDFKAYLHTGQPVAIHGRYLLPFIPVMLVAIGLCYSWALHGLRGLKDKKFLPSKVWLVVCALFLLLQGGGIITYIVRSDSTWFWDQDDKASQVNGAARKALRPIIIGH